MANHDNTTTTALKQLFSTLFDDESAIIVVVNPENEVLDYRVEPLSEIVALLALSGFGEPFEQGRAGA